MQKRNWKQYEFWPTWIFYAPFVPYWVLRSLQARSFSYFCKVNPEIEFGGFLDYSKYKILAQIPAEFLPKTQLISHKSQLQPLEFPFVVKPNLGERGINVEIIKNQSDWEKYPIETDLIVQEWIDALMEFGIFFAKNPKTQKGEILSITGKEFLTFKSDGKTTLRSFITRHLRAQSRKDYLFQKFADQLDIVFPEGNEIILEPIGNHNRGTKFIDSSHLINENLTQIINSISAKIEGFNYGRFDVKTHSIANLNQGKFWILEINGANSEATHIYDPRHNLSFAYKEVKRHLDRQFEIAKNNPKTYRSSDFYRAILHRIFG